MFYTNERGYYNPYRGETEQKSIAICSNCGYDFGYAMKQDEGYYILENAEYRKFLYCPICGKKLYEKDGEKNEK